MNTRRRFGLAVFALAIIMSMVACAIGGAAPTATPEPTNTPKPTNTPAPTNTPVPTNTSVPTDTPVAEEEPTNTPESGGAEPTKASGGTPGELSITTVMSFKDSFGYITICGLVFNDTKRAVDNIEIEVEVFDADDKSLYKETTYTDLWTLAPGEVSPFAHPIWEDLPTADHFVATIVGQGSAEVERPSVEIVDVKVTPGDEDTIYLTGVIKNNESDPVTVSDINGALFDTDDQLVTASSYSTLLRYIAPGEEGPFAITINGGEDLADTADSYEIYWDAEIADEATIYDITISEDIYDYQDNYGNTHLVGTITNNSDEALYIYLLGTLYDADKMVIDVAGASIPFSSIAPGETIPFDFSYGWNVVNSVDEAYEAADSYYIQVDYYSTYTAYAELVDLTTSGDVNEFDDDQAVFTGKVENNSGAKVGGAIVAVVLRDKETQQVLATNYNWIFDDIEKDGSADYEVNISINSDFDPDKIEYIILVKGEKD